MKVLSRQPEEDRGILSDAPEHGEIFKFIAGLAHDVDALVFEFREIVHGN